MAFDESTIVKSNTPAGPGYKLMVLAAPRLAAVLKPGQFVHVRVPALDAASLRRPFSVFDADPATGEVTILFKAVGRGSRALAAEEPGAEIRVMGPLGFGFPEKTSGIALLVGGGFGVAPLHFLAKRLAAAGFKSILFAGGRTKDDLLEIPRFEALGVECRLATNDGSAGEKGFVTLPLDRTIAELAAAGEAFELFTCGPDGLLKAVSDRALANNAPGWISMDRHMICGVGACYACIQKIRLPNGSVFNARCCVNGPVFKAKDIVWE